MGSRRQRGDGLGTGWGRSGRESPLQAGGDSALLLRTPGLGRYPTLPVSQADPRGL